MVVVFTLIIISSITFWYRQVIIQSSLANKLISQQALQNEVGTLIPFLKEKLEILDQVKLKNNEEGFLEINDLGEVRWIIDRSALKNNKIRFTFHLMNSSIEPLIYTVRYVPDKI